MRSCFSRPIGCSALAARPESDALIIQAMPATVPMPAITSAGRAPLCSRAASQPPQPPPASTVRNGRPGSSCSDRPRAQQLDCVFSKRARDCADSLSYLLVIAHIVGSARMPFPVAGTFRAREYGGFDVCHD